MLRVALVLLATAAVTAGSPELEEPFRVLDGGKAVDAAIGHAAPFLHDLDGDGRLDLLVGEFESGGLWIYRNLGEEGAPRFDGRRAFQAGGTRATVPSG